MRTFLFLNNWGGWQIAKWLHQSGEEIVGLIVQPESDQRFAPQILSELNLPPDRVWRAPALRVPETLRQIRELKPEMGVSGWFGYILKPELLEIFPKGCINLHTALLPWNRGWHTNVWPLLDGTPAGYTIHYIDEGVDTGDVIAQREIMVGPTDTAGSLHEKTTRGLVQLFKETWPLLREDTQQRRTQDHSKATLHRKAELSKVDAISVEKKYRGSEIVNLLRARTYPPYPCAYFVDGSNRVHMRVRLYDDTDRPADRSLSSVGAEPARLDLNEELTGREFLELFTAKAALHQPSLYFMDGKRRIFIEPEVVSERDFNPSATPAWMTNEAD